MKIALIVIVFFLALFVLPIVLIAHWGNQDMERYHQREREWLQFSMQHHCGIVKESTFWDAATTWQCDGNFQVRRYPN